jgi:hypothetical protein
MKSFSEIVDLASSTSRIANTRPQPLRDSVAGGAPIEDEYCSHISAPLRMAIVRLSLLSASLIADSQ